MNQRLRWGLLVFAFAAALGALEVGGAEKAEEVIRGLRKQFVAAVNARDVDKAASVWAPTR